MALAALALAVENKLPSRTQPRLPHSSTLAFETSLMDGFRVPGGVTTVVYVGLGLEAGVGYHKTAFPSHFGSPG